MTKVNLPMSQTGADLSFPGRTTWLLFGPPKSGKTTAACTWPEPLLLNTEPGGDQYVEAYKVQVRSLSDLMGIMDQLETTEGLPYRTVILDTIDVVSDWMEEAVCRDFNEKRLGEAKVFGADFSAHRMMALNLLTRLSTLPYSVVLVSHSRAIPSEGNHVMTIDLPGRLARSVMAAVSHIVFLECRTLPNATVDRRFFFLPTGLIESGSRHPVLTKAKACAPSYEAIRALFSAPVVSAMPQGETNLIPGLPARKTKKEG